MDMTNKNQDMVEEKIRKVKLPPKEHCIYCGMTQDKFVENAEEKMEQYITIFNGSNSYPTYMPIPIPICSDCGREILKREKHRGKIIYKTKLVKLLISKEGR